MKIALVDGYNLAFRAYYGMPDLAREKDGFPTGALHGWIRSLWWIEDNLKPDRILVFFDLGGASRQTALREDYKANRTETPEDLEKQIPVIKAWTRAAGFAGIEKDGIEADDLIAAYAQKLPAKGHEVMIVSADKDLAQLVNNEVKQWLPPPTANPKLGWRELDREKVLEKFGIGPEKIADYLAIVGDTSDNIPGLKGVGPKTACKWLQQYSGIEDIIAHCGELQPKRFQQVVHQQADNLRMNLEMTTLDPVHDVEDLDGHEGDVEEAVRILREMGMDKTVEKQRERLQG